MNNEKITALLSHISEKFPEITSLMYAINPKGNDTITDLEIHVFKGNDHIFEQMGDLKFKIGAKSFYQTNSEQAHELYKLASEYAGLTGKEMIVSFCLITGFTVTKSLLGVSVKSKTTPKELISTTKILTKL